MASSNDPMAAVRQYVDAFNSGDEQAMAAACADPMQILDGMAPHVWQGPTAAQDWWRDASAEAEHAGASGLHIGLGEPRHVDVTVATMGTSLFPSRSRTTFLTSR
jgi:SnoaL-like domain